MDPSPSAAIITPASVSHYPHLHPGWGRCTGGGGGGPLNHVSRVTECDLIHHPPQASITPPPLPTDPQQHGGDAELCHIIQISIPNMSYMMCMCLHVYHCVCVYMCITVCVSTCVSLCVCLHVYHCVCVYMCINVCVSTCVSMCVYKR